MGRNSAKCREPRGGHVDWRCFFSSRRRHTRLQGDWSSDVCSSDLRLLRRVWEYFDAAGPLVGTAWPIRYRWPDEQRVAHLRALGVLAYSALAYAHRPGMAADLNAWTMEFARATPGCLPSATFYPEPGVVDYVQAALNAGARVFKVHLQVGGFPADEPRLRPVWGLLAEAGVPVGGAARDAPVATAYTGPAPFAALLAQYPRLTAIVAHLGA